MNDPITIGAPRLMTPAEVNAAFRVHPRTITRWAERGYITSTRTLGGHRRFYEDEIRTLLESGEMDQR